MILNIRKSVICFLVLLFLSLAGCLGNSDQREFIDKSQIKLIGEPKTIYRVIRKEEISQNNCGGTESITNEIQVAQAILHTVEWGAGIEVSANGAVKPFGTGVDLGTTLVTQLGYTYGDEETISRSIAVSAKPSTNMSHRIIYAEVWDSMEVELHLDGQSEIIPFSFRRDFALQIERSFDLGCDSIPRPTPTDPPTQTVPLTSQSPLSTNNRFTLDKYSIAFVYVPSGNFLVGSTETLIDEALALCRQNQANCEREWFTDEIPQRLVFLEPFWIMETEVTNAQYRFFITAGGYTEKSFWSEEGWLWHLSENITQPAYWDDKLFSEDNQPVVGISWHEATAYANWLSVETNLIIRLPTEEEWEKAARGSAGLIFPWGNEWDGQRLNYQSDDKYSYSAPVGSYFMGMSAYGVLDMAGNVWEWTSSRYQEGVGSTAEKIVVRGGSWDNKPVFTRTSARGTSNPDVRPNTFGLRLVLINKP